MIEMKDRLYHCKKVNGNIKIFEDYEVTGECRTLKHCSCPVYTGTQGDGRKCNGLNHLGYPCMYAHWKETQ